MFRSSLSLVTGRGWRRMTTTAAGRKLMAPPPPSSAAPAQALRSDSSWSTLSLISRSSSSSSSSSSRSSFALQQQVQRQNNSSLPVGVLQWPPPLVISRPLSTATTTSSSSSVATATTAASRGQACGALRSFSTLWQSTTTGLLRGTTSNAPTTTTITTAPQKRTFASKKHKSVLKLTKGYRGRAKNCFSIAVRRLQKAWAYAYRDRRRKKRNWRTLWIVRLQAAARQYQWRYSQFIPALQASNITLNRKVLSELAATEPFSFRSVVLVVEQLTGERNGKPLIAAAANDNDVDNDDDDDQHDYDETAHNKAKAA